MKPPFNPPTDNGVIKGLLYYLINIVEKNNKVSPQSPTKLPLPRDDWFQKNYNCI